MYGVERVRAVNGRISWVASLPPLPSLKAAAVPVRQRPFDHPFFNTLDILATIQQRAQHFYANMTHNLKVFEKSGIAQALKVYAYSDKKIPTAAAASIPQKTRLGRSDLTLVSMESIRAMGVTSGVAFELRAAMQPDRSDRFESLFHT